MGRHAYCGERTKRRTNERTSERINSLLSFITRRGRHLCAQHHDVRCAAAGAGAAAGLRAGDQQQRQRALQHAVHRQPGRRRVGDRAARHLRLPAGLQADEGAPIFRLTSFWIAPRFVLAACFRLGLTAKRSLFSECKGRCTCLLAASLCVFHALTALPCSQAAVAVMQRNTASDNGISRALAHRAPLKGVPR